MGDGAELGEWGRFLALVLRGAAQVKVFCPLRFIFGFDKEKQWVPSQLKEANPDTPRVELRLDPVWGVRSLHSCLCFVFASLWYPGLVKTCFLLCSGGSGLTDTEGLASRGCPLQGPVPGGVQ